MKKVQPTQKIYLSDSKISSAGRGIFALNDIKKNEIIEICPVIVVPKNDVSNLKKSILIDYYFYWGKKFDKLAVALGYGSIYNHSYKPNATYKRNNKEKTIYFSAIKDINKDEEITVNYNWGNPEDKSLLPQKGIQPFIKS